MSDLKANFLVCRHCGITENHKVSCPNNQAALGFETVNPLFKFRHGCAWCGKPKCAYGCPGIKAGRLMLENTAPAGITHLPTVSKPWLSKIQIDRLVYLCREDEVETTYDIVNTAIEFFLHGSGNNPARAERLKALEDIAAMATVGATYPELMQYLQSEIDKAKGHPEIPQPTGE